MIVILLKLIKAHLYKNKTIFNMSWEIYCKYNILEIRFDINEKLSTVLSPILTTHVAKYNVFF